MSTNSKDRLMKPTDVAEYCGVTLNTLYQWNYSRTGPPYVRVGRFIRYRRADVETWLDGRYAHSVKPDDREAV